MNKENFVYYKLILEFKGTKFLGWQKQKDFNPTVQGELEKACKIIFKSDDIHTIGSGRTDTGVHSLDHHVKLKAPFKIENNSLLKALNSHLDLNIRVLSISDSDNSFLPTNHAKSKEYIYLFSNLESESAFQSDYIVNYRHDLNLELMKEACKTFIGRHDFKDFECTGSNPSSTIREIFACELVYHELDFHGILPSHYVFRVVGSGFLKQMIRLMIGTLWDIGRGKTSVEELKNSLDNPTGKRLGATAPANGLYKAKVTY